MQIKVRIIPNAKEFSVSLKDRLIKIYVPAEARNNKANLKAMELFSKALGKKVLISTGLKSRIKIFDIIGNADEVLKKIHALAQNKLEV